MLVTATEFKTNIGKYLTLVNEEEIVITKNGKGVAKLSPLKEDKVKMVESLFGIIPDEMTLEQAREERLKKHEHID
ncbi:type II toxin-antitoxin system Phd/YefM family antitoxin [Desulfosporosinus sp. BICA1-9]|uniref:type II toxin-antitoxin system Phd/YefM family antitoxin n=1 Tax=Desulfosporosinus sp. BICA1-9 TaxID=1531958 RepID=UPI00054B3273|nr:type II toxin-antitoxin system prevent-host-death family antitoxin [Desulfosporosinus sp. BICA1-9]KJS47373.1 MAG: prevent-host-death protein [Peptococcaceae bacterium BRH_c23]KJS88515.1 MAG: prevent-host-death protein [Desulfosporosinus sp. BICA1-9]HBW35161.1 type II toxin-antitoxin system prevent-host-death family antitoxin [Desulfosporosinus sp.]